MVDELEHKYEVKVQTREGRQKLPNEVKEILKEGGMMDEKGKLKLKETFHDLVMFFLSMGVEEQFLIEVL